MLTIPPQLQVFACLEPVDMRKSFDGLIGIVEMQLRQNPESGHLFLFFNRRRDRVKALHFAGDGFVIWYKQLCGGTFEVPRRPTAFAGETNAALSAEPTAPPPYLAMRTADLALILEGIDLASVRRRKRWRRE